MKKRNSVTLGGEGGAERRVPRAVPRSSNRLLMIFFFTLLLPISLEVAGLRLTPIRLFLLATSVPFVFMIVGGKAGRFTRVDGLLMLHGFWIVLALVVVHGLDRVPFAFITTIELVGGYFVGRIVVRSAEEYKIFIKFLLFSLIFLLPFSLIELFTGRLVIPEFFAPFFGTFSRASSAVGRLGLERVYAVFEHPILYGLYCSTAIANLAYYFRGDLLKRVFGICFALGMTFMSLSSAPLLSGAIQLGLLLWSRATKGAWRSLFFMVIVGYVVVDVLSNRTPITILIETVTFSSGTGWTRIAQFKHGMENVFSNPVFGLGINDWVRPYWLTGSVDNFWLLSTMRYGIVGGVTIMLSILVHMWCIVRAKLINREMRELRLGYTMALIGVIFSLSTVHIWGAAAVFIMFYIGAGAWIYTADNDANPEVSEKITRSVHRNLFSGDRGRPLTKSSHDESVLLKQGCRNKAIRH